MTEKIDAGFWLIDKLEGLGYICCLWAERGKLKIRVQLENRHGRLEDATLTYPKTLLDAAAIFWQASWYANRGVIPSKRRKTA